MNHEERVYHHTYETLEGIGEHAERIVALEELVLEAERLMQGVLDQAIDTVTVSDAPCCDLLYDHLYYFREDMRELGLEVDE